MENEKEIIKKKLFSGDIEFAKIVKKTKHPDEEDFSPIPAKEKQKLEKEQLRQVSKMKANYCRKCGNMLEYENFLETTNPDIDKNGKMSICINCIKKMLKDLRETWRDDYKATYILCQLIDLKYDETCVAEAIAYEEVAERKKTRTLDFFNKYWNQVRNKNRQSPFRYVNTKIENTSDDNNSNSSVSDNQTSTANDITKELYIKWGEFKQEDYAYLENKLKEYIDAYGATSPSAVDAFKGLCILLLAQRENPGNKDIVSNIQKQMTVCGITPEQLRKENRESVARTVGLTIAQMEMESPIDVMGDPKYAFDYDGLQRDKEDLLRSMKNHLTGSKDFFSEGVDLSQIFIDEPNLE